jgi:hypothetical protein
MHATEGTAFLLSISNLEEEEVIIRGEHLS